MFPQLIIDNDLLFFLKKYHGQNLGKLIGKVLSGQQKTSEIFQG